jgi:type II secretion system protein I
MAEVTMRRNDAGFTLIEVLVALAIGTMVVAALYRGLTQGWHGLRVAAREEIALSVAKERLESAGVELPLVEGTQSGESPEGISWSTEITRHEASGLDESSGLDEGAPRALEAYWVTVTVGWRESARSERTLELKTLKLQRRQ